MAHADTLLSDTLLFDATRNCIEAWNTLDLEATLATYTDDVVYRDPGTDGRIEGKENLRRFLAKFMRAWDMRFRVPGGPPARRRQRAGLHLGGRHPSLGR